MNDFWFVTTSNQPRLRDPTKVLRIIGRYWFDFDMSVTVEHAPEGHHYLKIEGDGWPGAWPLPRHASPVDFVPDYTTNGLEDFAVFLAAIAPFLMEPLVVQAIGTVDGRFPLSACEWRVAPGTGTVAKVEFTSSADAAKPPLFELASA